MHLFFVFGLSPDGVGVVASLHIEEDVEKEMRPVTRKAAEECNPRRKPCGNRLEQERTLKGAKEWAIR